MSKLQVSTYAITQMTIVPVICVRCSHLVAVCLPPTCVCPLPYPGFVAFVVWFVISQPPPPEDNRIYPHVRSWWTSH